ncbi:MAG: preprotein translocase subunit SecE [Actinomycetes bacterium]
MTETRAGGAGDAARATQRGRRNGGRGNPFARMLVFLRQVVAELKKVVRPTRSELLTYTSVVLVFVLAVMVFVSGLDLVFGRLVFWVFGG